MHRHRRAEQAAGRVGEVLLTLSATALQRLGFFVDRQRGSHVVLKSGCVIPMHREVAHGTLRSGLKMAGVTPEEFIDAI